MKNKKIFAKIKGFFKKLLNPKGNRHGAMAAGSIALTIVLVLVLNLALGALDSTVFDIDISDQSIYEISEISQTFAKGLEEDVDIIVIGVEDDIDRRISKFVERYAELSERMHVTYVNPVTTPSILDTYECSTDVVVVKNHNTGKFTTIPMVSTSDGAFIVQTLDYNTYSYKEAYFDGEGLMTGAVEYVTSDTSNTIYCLTGHNEVALPQNLTNLIRKANITLGDDVDILMDGGIPEDCDTLIINHPESDLAADELDAVLEYLEKGGNVILLHDDNTLENLNTLMNTYGLELLSGTLGDKTRFYSQYYQYYGYLCTAPVLSEESILTYRIADTGNAMIMNSGACQIMEEKVSMVSYDTFMRTSADGVLYIPGEEGEDPTEQTGTFTEAIVATIVLPDAITDNSATLALFACPYIIDDSVITNFPSSLNTTIFMNVLKDNLEDVTEFDILAKSLETTYVSVPNAQAIMILFIAVLPVCIFVFGLVLWIRRRKL